MRVLYFVALRLLFICMLDSNPRASTMMYSEDSLVIKTTSGLRESPVIKLGDEEDGGSEYDEKFGNRM